MHSAEALSELVNDLLDLSKVAAGKVAIRPSEFQVRELFGTLRGMLKPLLAANTAVSLVFDDPVDSILNTDKGKVSQILRNFISNFLKYTEAGEIRVSTKFAQNNTIVFFVSDTGIGIAPEDQERIFEEFVQVASPLQKKTKGTGYGSKCVLCQADRWQLASGQAPRTHSRYTSGKDIDHRR
jgi:signal transduction histidine kinase